MVTNKMGATLQVALRYENLLTPETRSIFQTRDDPNIWELVMEYIGDLSEVGRTLQTEIEVYDLGGGYAQLFISKLAIGNLSDEYTVIFLDLPNQMAYIDIGLSEVCASQIAVQGGNFNITGENILLGVVDSGINYAHPDFRNEDGTTRIKMLWDQTLTGRVPEGYFGGREFTEEEINRALALPTREEQLVVVPSEDRVGHGTAITGVASGNGRGSQGNANRGVAPGCDLIIVKVGRNGEETGPRDIDLMQGIKYVRDQAVRLQRQVVILLGAGYNLTSHNGVDALGLYSTAVYRTWASNIVVGTGNEGDRGSHASGRVVTGEEETIQLIIEGNMRSYACSIWKSFSDEFELIVQSPTGERTDVLSLLTPNRAYLFDNTAVMVNFSEPIIDVKNQEILVVLEAQGSGNINNGLWQLRLRGKRILEGSYNIWGSIIPDRGNRTRFLTPDLEGTLTSPSSTQVITSVATFNGQTGQLAPASGRGLTLSGEVKPDLAAPGINIPAPASQNDGYITASGSSIAAAFVAGAYVLMMSYGIYQLGNVSASGDVLKIYLIRNTRRPIQDGPYPNLRWGYGRLCIEAALNNMREVANQTN